MEDKRDRGTKYSIIMYQLYGGVGDVAPYNLIISKTWFRDYSWPSGPTRCLLQPCVLLHLRGGGGNSPLLYIKERESSPLLHVIISKIWKHLFIIQLYYNANSPLHRCPRGLLPCALSIWTSLWTSTKNHNEELIPPRWIQRSCPKNKLKGIMK